MGGDARCCHKYSCHKYVHTSLSATSLSVSTYYIDLCDTRYGEHTKSEPLAQPHPKDSSQNKAPGRALAARASQGLRLQVWLCCQLSRNGVERAPSERPNGRGRNSCQRRQRTGQHPAARNGAERCRKA